MLYQRYLPAVYSRICFTIPGEDVDDVTQEVFIAVIKSLKTFRMEAQFSTWLRTLINRQVADYYRRRNPPEQHMLQDYPSAFVINHSLTYNQNTVWDDRIQLQEAFNKLSASYKEILLMRFADGLRFYEIARLNEQSLEATKSLFRRAVSALGKQLKVIDG